MTTTIRPPANIPRFPLPPESVSKRQYVEGVPVPLTTTQKEELETFARSLYLDKSLFAVQLSQPAVRVPARNVESVLRAKQLAKHIYFAPRLPAVWPDVSTAQGTKVVTLNYDSIDSIPSDVKEYIASLGYELTVASRKVGYDYFTADDILLTILPESVSAEGTPTAFASTGHIAHMNLRDQWVPYKYVIGQVLLDKNKGIQTVVNKLDAIDTRFRTFAMELLAGKPAYEVTLTEHGCNFTFDFRHVYWNSRLEPEHARLVQLFGQGAVVVDAMAGVGPFAIPAARINKCEVWANDLNPASYESLADNAKANHVPTRVHAACEDAYTYIPRAVAHIWAEAPEGVMLASQQEVRKAQAASKEIGQKRREKALAEGLSNAPMPTPEEEAKDPVNQLPRGRPRKLPEHFVMNLPSTALDFLGAFRGAYRSLVATPERKAHLDAEIKARAEDPVAHGLPWPLVHVYCFTKDMDNPAEDLVRRANEALGIPADSELALRVPKQIIGGPERFDLSTLASSLETQKDWDPLNPGRAKATLTYVRTVSPNKDMYCLSFPLGPYVLLDLESLSPTVAQLDPTPVAPSTERPSSKRRKPNDLAVRDPKTSIPSPSSYWEPSNGP